MSNYIHNTMRDQRTAVLHIDVKLFRESIKRQVSDMTACTDQLREPQVTKVLKSLEKTLPDIIQKAVYSAVWDEIQKEL